jgi:hypothetical protein
MYLTEIRSRSKNTTYRCVLLRESYREGGKVKNRTLRICPTASRERSKPSG